MSCIQKRDNWDIYFHIRKRKSWLENDGAYNHSKAINEVFDTLQNGKIMTEYPNLNPIIMLMDPDLFIVDKNYYSFIKRNLEIYSVIGTRWTILKTHKFHCFPTPHLFITKINTLSRLELDYRSVPIARNISRYIFKFKPIRFLAMYNSYDPGSRMNNRINADLKILFIEQYYWKKEIESVKKTKKIAEHVGNIVYMNSIPSEIRDECSYWVHRSHSNALILLKNLKRKKLH